MLSEEFYFTRSHADACILFQSDRSGTVILCIYVDDALMIGDDEAIKKTVAQLCSKLSLKEVGQLKEYVCCTILRRKGEKNLFMWQPDLVKRMEKIFHDNIKNFKTYKTPTAPGQIYSELMKRRK